MSYILDALNKSQRQRRQLDVPTLDSPTAEDDAADGGRSRYANGALIAVTVVAVLFSLFTLMRSDDASVASRAPDDGAERAGPDAARTTSERHSPATRQVSLPAPTSAPPDSGARTPALPPTATPSRTSAHDIRTQPRLVRPRQPPRNDIPRAQHAAPPIDTPIAAPPERVRSETAQRTRTAPADEPAAEAHPIAAPEPALVTDAAALSDVEARLAPETVPTMHPETARLIGDLRSLEQRAARQAAAAGESRRSNDVAVIPPEQESLPDPELPVAGIETSSISAPKPPAAAAGLDAGLHAAPQTQGLAPSTILAGPQALPPGVQSSLGRLVINAHVYDDAPSERMVIVNMKRYREGDTLREGPTVETITRSGAILSYQSLRFVLGTR